MNAQKRRRHRVMRLMTVVVVLSGLLGISGFVGNRAYQEYAHYELINSSEYMSQNGRWDTIELPDDIAINAIHSAVLPTGKVLRVAGSGN